MRMGWLMILILLMFRGIYEQIAEAVLGLQSAPKKGSFATVLRLPDHAAVRISPGLRCMQLLANEIGGLGGLGVLQT